MKYEIRDFDNKKIGEVQLKPEIFSMPLRQDILARMVHWQLASRRSGTHATKGVSDISGTTKKPWRQKHHGLRANHQSYAFSFHQQNPYRQRFLSHPHIDHS